MRRWCSKSGQTSQRVRLGRRWTVLFTLFLSGLQVPLDFVRVAQHDLILEVPPLLHTYERMPRLNAESSLTSLERLIDLQLGPIELIDEAAKLPAAFLGVSQVCF